MLSPLQNRVSLRKEYCDGGRKKALYETTSKAYNPQDDGFRIWTWGYLWVDYLSRPTPPDSGESESTHCRFATSSSEKSIKQFNREFEQQFE